MDLFYTHISYRLLDIGYKNYLHICHILEPLLLEKLLLLSNGITANITNELAKSPKVNNDFFTYHC